MIDVSRTYHLNRQQTLLLAWVRGTVKGFIPLDSLETRKDLFWTWISNGTPFDILAFTEDARRYFENTKQGETNAKAGSRTDG